MKRILSILMLCIFTFIYTPNTMAIVFNDTSNHWAQGYINELSNRGYLQGYADGTFLPDKVMTKAEFVSVLLRCMYNSPAYNYNLSSTGHWADPQINEAVRQGIIVLSEYPQGFNKDNAINRAEVSAMVVRALGKQPDYAFASFKDNNIVNNSPYAGYIKVAHQEGLVTGFPDGEFKPYNYITRAQACSILSRYLTKIGTYTNSNYPNYNPLNPSTPASTKIATLAWEGYRYNPEYVDIYIDNKLSNYYLSDAYIVNANVLKLGGVNYNLSDNSLTIKLQNDYYTISSIYWVNGLATLDISKSKYGGGDYWRNISYSDIEIYDEDGYKLSRIDTVEFRTSGNSTRYELDEIEVDLYDNYIHMGNNKYKPYRVELRVKRNNSNTFSSWMSLVEVRTKNNVLIFDCDQYSDYDDDYIDQDEISFKYEGKTYYSDEVEININGTYRNFNRVYVLDRYEFEYGNRKYTLRDSMVRINGTYYEITSTEWKSNRLNIYLE